MQKQGADSKGRPILYFHKSSVFVCENEEMIAALISARTAFLLSVSEASGSLIFNIAGTRLEGGKGKGIEWDLRRRRKASRERDGEVRENRATSL